LLVKGLCVPRCPIAIGGVRGMDAG